VFERHIATPTGLDFAQAAVLYSFRHEHVTNLDGFAEALTRAIAGSDSTIIECARIAWPTAGCTPTSRRRRL